MGRKTKLFGRMIPIWLLVLALVAASAGAAVGTVLSGKVVGEVPVAVSQALLVGTPRNPDSANWSNTTVPQSVKVDWGDDIHADRFIGTHSDDQTAFQAAAEIDTGDKYIICVPVKNASNQDMVAELTLLFPDGITVEAVSADQLKGASNAILFGTADKTPSVAHTLNMTRTGYNTWKFIVAADAEKMDPETGTDARDCIFIVVAADDTIAPGFYTIEGQIEQISY